MYKYIYVDHNVDGTFLYKGCDIKGKIVFECVGNTITEADKLFEKETGTNPARLNYIGCMIIDN